MSDKHFELTDDTIVTSERILHRIRATRDIPERNIKKGDIGGFVESYDNLSDNAWVRTDAKVFGDARVFDDAEVCGEAVVFEYAEVYGNAMVGGHALLFGHAKVHEYARVGGLAVVCMYAEVLGAAQVYGCAKVLGNAKVYENAIVDGETHIGGNAEVKSFRDYMVFKNCWSSGRYFTWTRSNNMWKVGCFYGTGEELIAKAYNDSEESGRQYENIVNYVNTCIIGVK